MTSPRICLAMLGRRRNFAVARILAEAGWLERFYSDCSDVPSQIDPGLVISFPLWGFCRRLLSRLSNSHAGRLKQYALWNRSFAGKVAAIGFGNANSFYFYNTAGLEAAVDARGKGLKLFVDQITAPWQIEEPLIADEQRSWPQWDDSRPVSESDWIALADREQREWNIADCILCGSEYVRSSISQADGPVDKCRVVSYGTDMHCRMHHKPEGNEPLRVLFAGTVQLRKGIQYLLQAAEMIDRSQALFRVAGGLQIPAAAKQKMASRMQLLGPVSRDLLAEEYATADVLVLPSISEGSANVCYEALAAGVPVITTPNSGSVVRDGVDGFIVPIRDAAAIADKIHLLAADRSLLNKTSRNAAERRHEVSLNGYSERLKEVLLTEYSK